MNKVKRMLGEVEFLTLTTDMWTSNQTESYLALTGHYISKDWQTKSVLLACNRFVGPHTAIDIKNAVLQICQRWGIEGKINAIVSDNAANVVKSVEGLGWPHLPCLAHTLNLVVKDAIATIDGIRCKVKAICEYFRRSTSAADAFKAMQKSMMATAKNTNVVGNEEDDVIMLEAIEEVVEEDAVADDDGNIIGLVINYDDEMDARTLNQQPTNQPQQHIKKLINDVDTRWNSTLAMMERACTLQNPLVATIAVLQQKNASAQIPSRTPEDFVHMRETCKILQPFHQLTEELSAEKNVSGSKICIMLRSLQQNVRKFMLTDGSSSESAQKLAADLSYGLTRRFRSVEHNLVIALPAFLDPRFKKRGIETKEAMTKFKDEVQRLIINMVGQERYDERVAQPNIGGDENDDPIWGNFDKKDRDDVSHATPMTTAILELRQYSEELPLERHKNPLDWWKIHEGTYPHIAKLAKKHLSLVATSVPSERVFSKAGELISKKRNRLGSENVEKLMFLNGNMEHF